eukprot:CAMPEP_0115024494 /NCGR_PEP_ID=MMETSP0216-20121206/33287_1 /TAXON_ID=223996 /ORGANISM="Protocruzia adherens, Strain Boccale" /LENGTH=57 /DNA_ID=CAMNT_0002398595 /DNA_START=50 /DNA_END=219 /DNA_ORIENTATION=+
MNRRKRQRPSQNKSLAETLKDANLALGPRRSTSLTPHHLRKSTTSPSLSELPKTPSS